MMQIVPVALVPFFIDKVVELLKPAIDLSNGECTAKSVRLRLIEGRNILILVVDKGHISMAITADTIQFESGKKVLALPLMGGSGLDQLSNDFMPFVQNLAKSLGCTEIYGYAARKGWLRKLKDYNWSEFRYLIKNEVTS
tara:strand:+ start:42 stop:461 length:420 start_codon:yes stop_codon:yes gene_type:complete